MGIKLFLTGILAVLSFGLGLYFHDFQVSRKWEIIFLCLALAATLFFFWLLGQKLLRDIEWFFMLYAPHVGVA